MADQTIDNMSTTWNSGGTTFVANKMNVTDTASAIASLLFQYQVDGTDKFVVGKDGSMTIAGNLTIEGTSNIGRVLGEVVDYAGATAPAKWLLCFGQAISRTTYAALFAIIGTTYGVGDGSTTFNLPDLRGRVVAGQDDMGGVSANRLTSPLDGDTMGAAGGAESVVLSTANLAVHAHGAGTLGGVTDVEPAHTHSLTNGTVIGRDLGVGTGSSSFASGTHDMQGTVSANAGGAHSHAFSLNTGSSSSIGSGTAHANVQPTIILNKMIYAGV